MLNVVSIVHRSGDLHDDFLPDVDEPWTEPCLLVAADSAAVEMIISTLCRFDRLWREDGLTSGILARALRASDKLG